MNGLYESYYIPHVLRRAQGREQRTRDEHGRKTSQPFSTFTFGYENQSESDKAGHENERELTEYREFRKRTKKSSGIMSNTVGIRKINTEYRPVSSSCNPYVFPHAKIH